MDGRRPDAQPLLRFATVPEPPVYRAIIEVFTAAATGYNGRLSPEDVRAALVACVYDLTPGGEAAAEALATLEEGLRRVGGLHALPDPGTGLARLAQRVLGRAHALDRGPVASAVSWLSGSREAPSSAAERRAVWAAAGVATDTVSSPVLTLGLRLPGEGPLPVTLRVNAAAGLAVRLTLAQVTAHLAATPIIYQGAVFLCEDPSAAGQWCRAALPRRLRLGGRNADCRRRHRRGRGTVAVRNNRLPRRASHRSPAAAPDW